LAEVRFFPQALADDVVGRAAVEDPLPAGVVGKLVALEEALQGIVGADAHDPHLASDAAVEALNHAVIRYARSRCHWRLAGSLTIWHMVSPSGTRGTGITKVRAGRR
jgi:hypothetical protein